MKKRDFEIGPCFTYPEFRGRGIYVKVIKSICSQIGNNKTVFYMIVDKNNIASVKGIEKAGFRKYGEVKVSKIFKRYRIAKIY
jgi:RimJ/RimL family protein N-acetyltransferase